MKSTASFRAHALASTRESKGDDSKSASIAKGSVFSHTQGRTVGGVPSIHQQHVRSQSHSRNPSSFSMSLRPTTGSGSSAADKPLRRGSIVSHMDVLASSQQQQQQQGLLGRPKSGGSLSRGLPPSHANQSFGPQAAGGTNAFAPGRTTPSSLGGTQQLSQAYTSPALASLLVQQQREAAATAAVLAQEAVAEVNEKMTGYIVQALTDIPPVTRNGRLAGAVDEDGFLDLQLASVHAHLGSVEGETVLRTAALGLTPEAAQVVGGVPMNVVREAVIGARPPHPHDMIAITARSAAAAMPRSDAELRLHSDAAPFVQYHKGQFAPALDGRQASDFPTGTAITAAHALFEFNPTHILCLHIDNLRNGYPAGTDMNARTRNDTVVNLGLPQRINIDLICRQVASMVNLEILYFRNNNVSKLDWANFPKLRQLDLSANKIKSAEQVSSMASRCPSLVMLVLLKNPVVATWKQALPPNGSPVWKAIGVLPKLRSFNREQVPSETLRVVVAKHASPLLNAQLRARLFDEAVQRALGPAAAHAGRATKLSLRAMSLESVFLGSFVNVTHLDLSHNTLPLVLQGNESGIQRCVRLMVLYLTECGIADPQHLNQLANLPYISQLRLAGNPVAKLDTYRATVLYLTRSSRGSVWRKGLATLDDVAVGEADIAAAVTAHEDRAAGLHAHWLLLLQHRYGWGMLQAFASGMSNGFGHQLTSPGSMPSMAEAASAAHYTLPVRLTASQASLEFVDLRGPLFAQIECLDLSHNNLTEVKGLGRLRHLKHLDLCGNINLDVATVLHALKGGSGVEGSLPQPVTTLVSISLLPTTPPDGLRDAPPADHTARIVVEIGIANAALAFIEGFTIPPKIRTRAFNAWVAAGMCQPRPTFRAEVAVLAAFAPARARSFSPGSTDLAYLSDPTSPLSQFNAAHVGALRELRGLGLDNAAMPQLTAFRNLRILDLSHNALMTLEGLGLESISTLRGLDVSFNHIRDTPIEIARTLNALHALLMVAVRNNPGMAAPGAHITLLAELRAVSRPEDAIVVVDKAVTPLERAGAWRSAHADLKRADRHRFEREAEQLRANALLADIKPLRIPSDQVQHLGLARQRLPACPDVSQYNNLLVLALRSNSLKHLVGTGIKTLQHLRVLDLRGNHLSMRGVGFSQLLEVVDALRELVFLGVAGNRRVAWCQKGKLWERILLHAANIRNPECPLRFIDMHYVCIDDVVRACRQDAIIRGEIEAFRYAVALARRRPQTGVQAAVQSLIMSPTRRAVVARHPDPLRSGTDGGAVAQPSPIKATYAADITHATALHQAVLENFMSHSLSFQGGDNAKMSTPGGESASASAGTGNMQQTPVAMKRALVREARKRRNSFQLCQGAVRAYVDMVKRPPADPIPLEDIETLNLSVANLRFVDVTLFTSLTELNISHNMVGDKTTRLDLSMLLQLTGLDVSHNLIDADMLASLGLEAMLDLRVLRVNHNQLIDSKTVWPMLQALTVVEHLNVLGNPCFRRDSNSLRNKFIVNLEGSDRRNLHLSHLNGRQISVHERCRALQASRRDPELSRLDLVLEALDTGHEAQSLDLSNQRLVNLALLAYQASVPNPLGIDQLLPGSPTPWSALRELNVSHNRLTTLLGQGLHMLPALDTLDLKSNRLLSVDHIIDNLHRCRNLTRLCMLQSTGKADTSSPEKFMNTVFSSLRGVLTLDGIDNPTPLETTQHDAIAFLDKYVQASANNIKHMDLRGKGMRREHFVWVLAAMSELPVQTLWLKDNPWDHGVGKRLGDYRRFVIASMSSDLLSIDGVQITDDERANALVFVLNEEKKFGAFLKRGGWPEHKEAAIDLFSRAPTSESDPVSPTKQDVLLPTVYTTAAFTRTPKSTAQEDGNDQEKGDAKLSAARGPHDTSLAAQAQVSRVDQAIEASGAAMAGKVTGTGMGAAGTLFDVGVTAATGFLAGSLLTKAEIAINFFQVYGLVLSLPITFEWPWLWKAVSDVYLWFAGVLSVDIDSLMNKLSVTVPDLLKKHLSFLAMMLLMAALLILYLYASLMERRSWIRKYYHRWSVSRRNAALLWVAMMLVAVVLGVAYDWSGSVGELLSGRPPSDKFIGVSTLCAALFSFAFLPWVIMVNLFRHYYIHGAKRDSLHRLKHKKRRTRALGGPRFLLFWSRMKRFLQRVSLFFLTVFYMPASKLILRTFAPSVDPDVLGTDCPYTNSVNQTCCLLIEPTQPCIGSSEWNQLTEEQILSIPFLLAYVIAMPLFFMWLVSRGVHEVYIGGYRHRVTAHHRKMEMLKDELEEAEHRKNVRRVIPADGSQPAGLNAQRARTVKQIRLAMRVEQRRIKRVYTFEVQQNPKAQTYLYQPYSYKHRFQKIAIMVFKLMIVMIALFAVPAAEFANLPFALSTIVLSMNVVWLAVSRPFADGTESIQAASSHVTNLINSGVAFALGEGAVSDGVATALMLAFNGINLVLMVSLLIVSPIRAVIHHRRMKEEEVSQAERIEALEKKNGLDPLNNSEVMASRQFVVEHPRGMPSLLELPSNNAQGERVVDIHDSPSVGEEEAKGTDGTAVDGSDVAGAGDDHVSEAVASGAFESKELPPQDGTTAEPASGTGHAHHPPSVRDAVRVTKPGAKGHLLDGRLGSTRSSRKTSAGAASPRLASTGSPHGSAQRVPRSNPFVRHSSARGAHHQGPVDGAELPNTPGRSPRQGSTKARPQRSRRWRNGTRTASRAIDSPRARQGANPSAARADALQAHGSHRDMTVAALVRDARVLDTPGDEGNSGRAGQPPGVVVQ